MTDTLNREDRRNAETVTELYDLHLERGFLDGYRDYLHGQWRGDNFACWDASWRYEEGRETALACGLGLPELRLHDPALDDRKLAWRLAVDCSRALGWL